MSQKDQNTFGRNHWTEADYAQVDDITAMTQIDRMKTIRVSFVDQHGLLRGKTLVGNGALGAIEKGVNMTSTLLLKDTSHTTVFPVWQEDAGFGAGQFTGASDMVMVPVPSSFRLLPWSNDSGWMLADLFNPDGREVEFSARRILRNAVNRLESFGYRLIVGLEVELHVFAVDDASPDGAVSADMCRPLSAGKQLLTEARYDAVEEIMELIRSNAAGLGLPIRSLEVEFGPSQFEVTFDPADAMTQADNVVLFRSMVKQVCNRNGLHATFMCKPRISDVMASGWHLHQSLVDVATGENVFIPRDGQAISPVGQQWIAGLLAHARDTCVFATPTVNGYKRYGPFALAPDRIQWGRDNRGAMIRCLANPGDSASRIENRIGEPAANPYFYFTAQILAGLDGIEAERQAPAPVTTPYSSTAELLPQSLGEALDAFHESRFCRDQFGDRFVEYYHQIKLAEWERYLKTVSVWEMDEYFNSY